MDNSLCKRLHLIMPDFVKKMDAVIYVNLMLLIRNKTSANIINFQIKYNINVFLTFIIALYC